MEKQDILLQMLEQPEKYTAQQWLEILDDPSCRRLYDLMSLTGSDVGSKSAADKLTDDNILQQWEKVETANQANEKNTVNHAKITSLRRWKIAVVVLAVVCFTGLAASSMRPVNRWNMPTSLFFPQVTQAASPVA
jgi:hypothetical protein